MTPTQLLFSFSGRINRAKYWLIALVFIVVSVIAIALALFAGGMGTAIVVGFILYIPMLWIALAVGAKRLHDRNKSGWWMLLFYIAPGILQTTAEYVGDMGFVLNIIGTALGIWGLIELGLLRGTEGANQYGPDPLQPNLGTQPA
jgi:uncharacterized membrane protein YhaH (DUF805 family)